MLSARRGCRPCVFCWGKLSTLRSLPGEAIDNVPPASRSCRDWIPCQEKLLTLLFTPLIRYRHADPCSEKLSTLSILPREAVDTASWQEKALQFLPGEAINSLCPARTICPRFVPARGSFLQFVSCQEKHRPFASCQEKLSALDNLPVEAGDTSFLVRRSCRRWVSFQEAVHTRFSASGSCPNFVSCHEKLRTAGTENTRTFFCWPGVSATRGLRVADQDARCSWA